MISTNFTDSTKINPKYFGLAGAALTLAVPFFIFEFGSSDIEHSQSLCPFKMLTGFPCPGCGITKSMIFFYQGNWVKSLQYHFFGPATVIFCILTVMVLIIELYTRKKYFREILYNRKIAYYLAAGLMIYHACRIFFFIKENSLEQILRESIWR